MSCGYDCEYDCEGCDVPDRVVEFVNGYNKALEDIKNYILNSCNNVTCREDINVDNDFDFYASELLDMLEEIKK